ncbi:GntP family permease [Vibrio sinaloensis]|uniref:GntP family permease n=1 Tax=Photobacterium sp. (strain ATCC 43367) TaxID=379097 RepID=UPI0020164C31|nr:SLC13 family permease [Vibrio sinaloensis]UPQ89350.1 SLC13 family permease [Vibrio sinaloensis]
MIEVSTLGALTALVVAIALILKKVPPAYGMIIGALIGGVIGGVSLTDTVNLMVGGAQDIVSAVLRILTAGVLAGVLIESGAATSIAETIIKKVGETRALLALAIATMILTGVGVFVDAAVITVSPIALAIARRADLSKTAILFAMVSGGKAGNVMSPNPNAIAAADAFNVPLTSVMAAGVIPGLCGLVLAYFIAKKLVNKGSKVDACEVVEVDHSQLPSFNAAIVAPLVVIVLLCIRPIAGIDVDPMIALPVGGLVGAVVMGRFSDTNHFAVAGLSRMAPVAVLLLGTGTLAGIIANSGLKEGLIDGLTASGLPSFLLAPASGAIMALATASTTAGTAVAASVFSSTILELGVPALAGAAMIHSGAMALDHMPHGGFFHATGGAVHMDIRERLKLIPYESAVGLLIAFVSTMMFGVFGLFV